MIANPGKFHKLVSKNWSFVANIGKNKFFITKMRSSLRVTLNSQLTSSNQVIQSYIKFHLYKTVSNELDALARVVSYMDQDKKIMLFNSYFSPSLTTAL